MTEPAFLTMRDVADLLRLEAPPGPRQQQRRAAKAKRRLVALERATGKQVLVYVGRRAPLTSRALLAAAAPDLFRAPPELKALRRQVRLLREENRRLMGGLA